MMCNLCTFIMIEPQAKTVLLNKQGSCTQRKNLLAMMSLWLTGIGIHHIKAKQTLLCVDMDRRCICASEVLGRSSRAAAGDYLSSGLSWTPGKGSKGS